MYFHNKNIILGLTGSIAIYKSASLLRRLQKKGAEVRVVMTDAAQEFMSTTVFDTLTDKQVMTDLFEKRNVNTRHIELKKWSDAILVAPATANIIAKTASGLADDLLSAVILTNHNKNVVYAPAMNTDMYGNPITLENIDKLRGRGYSFVEPEAGELACGDTGKGRLAKIDNIVEALHREINGEGKLEGKNVVVTAGPTREYLDQIRFISNRSTGKMGYALASEAAKEGAESVTLISGPTDLEKPFNINRIEIKTAQEMQAKLESLKEGIDIVFMAAAVEDISPVHQNGKIKKSEIEDAIKVKKSNDIISAFREKSPETCLVGFSVEIEQGVERSRKKLEKKGLDYIVWNDPSQEGAGFQSDTNECVLINKDGKQVQIPRSSKREVAEQIISEIQV